MAGHAVPVPEFTRSLRHVYLAPPLCSRSNEGDPVLNVREVTARGGGKRLTIKQKRQLQLAVRAFGKRAGFWDRRQLTGEGGGCDVT